ncbi:ATP-binding cassette domain-containing protein [Mycobacteroides franklinii]|uniref:ATP-binding cassette domain-containing protein n=1 Tax=Mycobacteroides franklinii TaxID=948102 RepID=UPI0013E8E1FE|nr:phosphonate ABC transporter ATP-binding protein [Mycobacteroides franklinii]
MDSSAEFASPKRLVGDVLAGSPTESAQPGRAQTHAPAITFDHVTVSYGRGKNRSDALRNFNLRIARGETVALLGPSGSGKSTALKALAGFVRPSFGTVRLDGRDVTDLPPAKRGIGVVVQSYALFPHMRVRDNVAFGLRARGTKSDRVAARVEEALAMVSMSAYADRYPRELSGGQQQRVAVARALAIRPRVLLLDEPLAALDAQLRQSMIAELQQLQQTLSDTAMLYVTHDQSEALALADRIAVMRNAELVDVDTAQNLWARPPSDFTAGFLGGANLIPCTIGRMSGESALVSVGDKMLSVVAPKPEIGRDPWAPGANALICVRPHALSVVAATAPRALRARVATQVWRGASTRLSLAIDGFPDQLIDADVPGRGDFPPDSWVGVKFPEPAGVLVTVPGEPR